MVGRIHLSAFGIHSGGGGALLAALLPALVPHAGEIWLDARWSVGVDERRQTVHLVARSLSARLRALRAIAHVGDSEDVLLCFNGLPPLSRPCARTILYLQNRFLLTPLAGEDWAPDTRLRLAAERILLRATARRAARIWVQGAEMAELASALIGPRPRVEIVPLVPVASLGVPLTPSAAQPGGRRFCYPAFAGPHKNHPRLFAAWALLEKEGIVAELAVTLDELAFQAALGAAGLKSAPLGLTNLGPLAPDVADRLLLEMDALLFPSLAESHGLPLAAANAAGKPVLAPERNYVRDAAIPVETFDPLSPRSIADAVRRFLGAPRLPSPVLAPEAFVERLLSDA